MRVWIIATGEPVPFLKEEEGSRFLRAGRLARHLAEAGHQVVWWTARFDHYGKRHRNVPANTICPSGIDGLDLVFLDSCGYQTHISPRRFRDHGQVGANFRQAAPDFDAPDVILCSFPLVETADEAVRYGRTRQIPVVLDIRDLWPDVFYERISSRLKIPVPRVMVPYEIKCRRAFRQADAVISITDGMLDWVYDRFGRVRGGSGDQVFRQTKARPVPVEGTAADLTARWRQRGVDLDDGKLRFVWSGSIIPDTDGPTLLKAVALLPPDVSEKIEIVICGVGALVPDVEATAQHHPCLKYAGWVPEDELNHLLSCAHIGLLCYLDRPDFQMSTPNKVIDYCAAGMRILTNLQGEVAKLTKDPDFLIHYPTGDAEALAGRITSLMSSPSRFAVPSEAALQIFETAFNADRVLPEMEEYLRGLSVCRSIVGA